MTRLRYDWYDKNDDKVIIGLTHNIEFKRTNDGMIGKLVDVIDDSVVYEILINHQEELNDLFNQFSNYNSFDRNFVFEKV